jgi:hypothetical protein
MKQALHTLVFSLLLSLGACGGGGSPSTSPGTGTGTGIVDPNPVTPTPTPSVPVTPTPTQPSITAPVVTEHPQSTTVTTGSSVNFTVKATGTDLQYQWLRNGSVVSGATQASYALPATPLSETETQWSVKVSNSAGSVISAAALLRVWAAPRVRVLAGAAVASTGSYSPLPMLNGQSEAARFSSIRSLILGSDGTAYAADGGVVVRAISTSGFVNTIAGQSSGDSDGIGESAQFGGVPGAIIPPYGNTCGDSVASFGRVPCMDLAIDAVGDIYVADARSHALRKMTPAFVVSTLAGDLTGPISLRFPAWQYSSIRSPMVFADGTLAFVDRDNSLGSRGCQLMRLKDDKMTSLKFTCTPLDESNYEDGQYKVESVTRDPNGLLFIASKQTAIERVSPTAISTLLAGSLTAKGYVNGTGASARFGRITGIASDSMGNVYVADETNRAIRKISVNGAVSTVAGTWPAGETPPVGALVNSSMIPYSIALDENRGRILVSDMSAPDSWNKYPTVVLEVQMAP